MFWCCVTCVIFVIFVSVIHLLPILARYSGEGTRFVMDLFIKFVFGNNEDKDVYITLKMLWLKKFLTALLLAIFITGGACFCAFTGDYDGVTSFYWATQTLSTVGS